MPSVEFEGEMLKLHREAFIKRGRVGRWEGKSQLDIAIALDFTEQEVLDITLATRT